MRGVLIAVALATISTPALAAPHAHHKADPEKALVAARDTCVSAGWTPGTALYDICFEGYGKWLAARPADRPAVAELVAERIQVEQQREALQQQAEAQAQQQAQAQAQADANAQAYAQAAKDQARAARLQQSYRLMQIGAQLMQGPPPPQTSTQTYWINGRMHTCTTTGTVTNCN